MAMRRENVAAALKYLQDKADLRGRFERATSLDPQEQDLADIAVETGASLVPGVGPALAARDFERARRADDPAGMAMAAASAVPGGKLAGLLKRYDPVMRELDVYHGTPHKFPATEANPLGEFDASKIGTGHGAQAYGEGIYYSESPEFAGSFAPMNKSSASARASFIRLRDQAPKNSAEWKHYDDLAKEGFGSVYKADLPDEMVEKMLDYNKAIKDQTKYVKAALSEIGIDTELDKPASVIAHGMEKRLLEVGIPGLIYREKGGPRNFVVFPGEEKKVRILERK